MENLEIAFKMHKGTENGKEGDSFLYRDNLFMVAEGVGGGWLCPEIRWKQNRQG